MTLHALLIQALFLLLLDGNLGGLKLREILDTNIYLLKCGFPSYKSVTLFNKVSPNGNTWL